MNIQESTSLGSQDTASERNSDFNFQGQFPTLSELEGNYIQYIYQQMNRHQGRAAQILGVSRRTLYRKLRATGLH